MSFVADYKCEKHGWSHGACVACLYEEIGRLHERLSQYEDDFKKVMAEKCAPDEHHCSCVPHLRRALKDKPINTVEVLRRLHTEVGGALDALDPEAFLAEIRPKDKKPYLKYKSTAHGDLWIFTFPLGAGNYDRTEETDEEIRSAVSECVTRIDIDEKHYVTTDWVRFFGLLNKQYPDRLYINQNSMFVLDAARLNIPKFNYV